MQYPALTSFTYQSLRRLLQTWWLFHSVPRKIGLWTGGWTFSKRWQTTGDRWWCFHNWYLNWLRCSLSKHILLVNYLLFQAIQPDVKLTHSLIQLIDTIWAIWVISVVEKTSCGFTRLPGILPQPLAAFGGGGGTEAQGAVAPPGNLCPPPSGEFILKTLRSMCSLLLLFLCEENFFPSLHYVPVPDPHRRLQMCWPYLKHKQGSRDLSKVSTHKQGSWIHRQTKIRRVCGRSTKLRYHVKLCTAKLYSERQSKNLLRSKLPKGFSNTNLSLEPLQNTTTHNTGSHSPGQSSALSQHWVGFHSSSKIEATASVGIANWISESNPHHQKLSFQVRKQLCLFQKLKLFKCGSVCYEKTKLSTTKQDECKRKVACAHWVS